MKRTPLSDRQEDLERLDSCDSARTRQLFKCFGFGAGAGWMMDIGTSYLALCSPTVTSLIIGGDEAFGDGWDSLLEMVDLSLDEITKHTPKIRLD
jgi:hypothetical protein